MLGPSLTVSHLAIATVCTAMMLGLGFLARPGKATALWSAMYVVWLTSAFLGVTADLVDSGALWLVAVGLIISVPAYTWSGLRAFRGAPSYAWIPVAVSIAAIGILILSAGQPGFHLVGRAVFLAGALFNVLVVQELFRGPQRAQGFTVPLILSSGAWVVLGVVGIFAGALNLAENYELLTQSNAVAAMIYQIAALATLLFMIRDTPPPIAPSTTAAFYAQAADRLDRAKSAGEHTWTLLDIRLDDADELRAATGGSRFAQRSERFHEAVRSAFPAEADVAAVSEGRALVLVSRTASAVSASIRRLMTDLEAIDKDLPTAPQVSASIGWADVSTAGYEFEGLLAAADARAEAAVAEGGDRWKRD
ncbi:hypothetical protein [Microbacterium terregens]|uniref:GGDEF domain-containing protein n=1 Tax=Microbacterium terregens TaxID=69363 RepID=A0ABV5T3J8_9MICO